MSSSFGGLGGALFSAKQSAISQVILGTKSLFQQRGGQALTPFINDDTKYLAPSGGGTGLVPFGGQLVYNIPKTSTLVGKVYAEFQIPSQSATRTTGAAGTVAYQKNLGDRICRQHQFQYGTSQIQLFPGNWHCVNRTLTRNEVNIEGINQMVLGSNLIPGAATEAILISAFENGVTVRAPIEELFFTHYMDEHWMPEAYALEAQLIVQVEDLLNLIYKAQASVVTPANAVQMLCKLRYQEFILSAAEKQNRLALYKTLEGHIIHTLDLELQQGQGVTGVVPRIAGSPLGFNDPISPVPSPDLIVDIPVPNFRLDMAEIVFYVQRVGNTFAVSLPQETGVYGLARTGSFMESNLNTSVVTGNSIATLIPLRSFRLMSGSQIILDAQPESWNRQHTRKYYHPDAQASSNLYCIPLCRFPEDYKNATGHLSSSVLGQLHIECTVADPGPTITMQGFVFDHGHNLIQARAGGVAKALY